MNRFSTEAANAGKESPSTALRWTIIGLFSLGMMIAYVDRVNLSVALTDADFKASFHLTDQDRGVLNSAFFWSYVLLAIPAGSLVDRYGAKYPCAIGLLLWSAVSAAAALAGSVGQLLFLRVLLGIGESVISPGAMRWIRFHCSENQRGLAVGVFLAATKFGPAVGTLLSAWLIAAYGWRLMFVLLGIGSFVWLIPWLLLVKNDARQSRPEKTTSSQQNSISLRKLLASPAMWGIAAGAFSYMYFVYFCMTWMPVYFVERRGLSLNSMGIYTVFSFSGMAIIATAAGWLADRSVQRGWNAVKVRRGFTIAGLLLASTSIIGALSDSASVALFFAVFSLSGLGLTTANYWVLTQTIMPGMAIGRAVGIQHCAANLPGIVAPLLTGWLKHSTGSFEAPMYAIGIFLILGVAAYVFLVQERYAPRAE